MVSIVSPAFWRWENGMDLFGQLQSSKVIVARTVVHHRLSASH